MEIHNQPVTFPDFPSLFILFGQFLFHPVNITMGCILGGPGRWTTKIGEAPLVLGFLGWPSQMLSLLPVASGEHLSGILCNGQWPSPDFNHIASIRAKISFLF